MDRVWQDNDRRYDTRKSADRFGAARLFKGGEVSARAAGMPSENAAYSPFDPYPDERHSRIDYRPDAYRDAPRVVHGRMVRFAMRPGLYYGLIGGAGVAALFLFFAGFLAAYVIFSTDGYPRAGVDTAQSPGLEETGRDPIIGEGRSGNETFANDGVGNGSALARPAQAIGADGGVLTPAPEIAAALEAQRPTVREVDPALFETPSTADLPVAERPVRPRLKPTPPTRDGEVERDLRVLPGAESLETAAVSPSHDANRPVPRVVGGRAPYSLQFGAFGRQSNAERMLRRLSGLLSDARIETGTGADGVGLFYVRAGGYETRVRAERALQQLRRENGLIGIVHADLLEG